MNQQLPHDIYGLFGYGILWYEWLIIVLILILLGGLAYALLRFIRRKKPARKVTEPKQSTFEVWRDRIEQLKAEAPFVRSKQVEFYYQLSLAVRSGIEAATGLMATDLTYKELRQQLKQGSWSLPLDEQDLLRFLNKADFVKFAEQDCTIEQSETDRKQTLEWLSALQSYYDRRQTQEVRT